MYRINTDNIVLDAPTLSVGCALRTLLTQII